MKRAQHTKSLTDADYRALAEFRHQLRQFLQFSEDVAHTAGVPARQHQALLAIKGFAPITVGELAEKLGIKPHSAGELVNRLTAAKLVRRVSDKTDGRRIHLNLTPIAERRLELLTVAHHAELRRLATSWAPLFDVLVVEHNS
jgi:DNA-binding MarR family transcriptional regulator